MTNGLRLAVCAYGGLLRCGGSIFQNCIAKKPVSENLFAGGLPLMLYLCAFKEKCEKQNCANSYKIVSKNGASCECKNIAMREYYFITLLIY